MSASRFKVGADGWLDGAYRRTSPNADARPAGSDISLAIVHNISVPPGRYGGGYIERLFCNDLRAGEHAFLDRLVDARLSAHFLVDRSGLCTQFVSCHGRAWHAGSSSFRGRPRCNDYSLGIELEGTDFEPYADAQYTTLNRLLSALRAAFPIEAVVGHSDVAHDRKTDPGPFFRWDRLELPSHLLSR